MKKVNFKIDKHGYVSYTDKGQKTYISKGFFEQYFQAIRLEKLSIHWVNNEEEDLLTIFAVGSHRFESTDNFQSKKHITSSFESSISEGLDMDYWQSGWSSLEKFRSHLSQFLKAVKAWYKSLQEPSTPKYLVLNCTDGIYVTFVPVSEQEADEIIEEFPKRFIHQGYYLTANGERINPLDVVLEKQLEEETEDDEILYTRPF